MRPLNCVQVYVTGEYEATGMFVSFLLWYMENRGRKEHKIPELMTDITENDLTMFVDTKKLSITIVQEFDIKTPA